MNKLIFGMAAIILFLLVVISIQLPQLGDADELDARAERLGAASLSLLRALDVHCAERPDDFEGIVGCIEPVLEQDDFSRQSFRPYRERDNETGVFVIRNDGAQTYNGSRFALTINGEPAADGCHISSEIRPEYTCRFDLESPCREGDVYAVSYDRDGESVPLVIETCR